MACTEDVFMVILMKIPLSYLINVITSLKLSFIILISQAFIDSLTSLKLNRVIK